MNKSLSESHPTLWFELDRNGFPMDDDNSMWVFKKVQSCTVDVAEYERLKKELEDVRRELLRMDADLIEQQSIGERRTMERVKVFVTQARHNSVELFGRAKPEWCEGVEDTLKELERIFGLGGEEESKDTDNGSYQNKGDRQ